jgi:hypothetical protein
MAAHCCLGMRDTQHVAADSATSHSAAPTSRSALGVYIERRYLKFRRRIGVEGQPVSAFPPPKAVTRMRLFRLIEKQAEGCREEKN